MSHIQLTLLRVHASSISRLYSVDDERAPMSLNLAQSEFDVKQEQGGVVRNV